AVAGPHLPEALRGPHGKTAAGLVQVQGRRGRWTRVDEPRDVLGYDQRVEDALRQEGDLYLDGFWQSEKYFRTKAEEIRAEIRPPKLNKGSEAIAAVASSSESVSLHVRRGDYVSDQGVAASQGAAGPEYYAAALEEMERRRGRFRLFIFSDDIEWVRKNMSFRQEATYVSGVAGSDLEELALMATCHHNIIANSTFSWWGAWLNPNQNKTVIAPSRWVTDARYRSVDVVPDEWIKL
ncbi:MAG: alpha-1,2-fucosyltransferase, partial [Methanomassiliicoccales archaeon]